MRDVQFIDVVKQFLGCFFKGGPFFLFNGLRQFNNLLVKASDNPCDNI